MHGRHPPSRQSIPSQKLDDRHQRHEKGGGELAFVIFANPAVVAGRGWAFHGLDQSIHLINYVVFKKGNHGAFIFVA